MLDRTASPGAIGRVYPHWINSESAGTHVVASANCWISNSNTSFPFPEVSLRLRLYFKYRGTFSSFMHLCIELMADLNSFDSNLELSILSP